MTDPLRKLLVRGASGSLFVLSVLGTLLFVTTAYYVVMTTYAVLVFVEFLKLRAGFGIHSQADRKGGGLIITLFGGTVWVLLPFALVILAPTLLDQSVKGFRGAEITAAMFVLIWVHDSFAYLTGISVGKHLLAPRISPAKTWEGALGGLLFTLAAAWLIWISYGKASSLTFWLVGGLIVTIASNAGDLLQSKLKRAAGVKDSGNMMPGHGGFFDRFDAVLVTAPAWVLWVWLAQ